VLPDAWVERIFSRLEGRYGAMFHDRWKGCDLANVRATWAEELAPFAARPEAIGYALKVLAASKFPPTLPEFLDACRNAPEPYRPALPPPSPVENQRAMVMINRAATVITRNVGEDFQRQWATHPRSIAHLRMILDGARRDPRLQSCVEEMLERGVCTADGKLLKVWQHGQWQPILRNAA